MYRCEVRIVRSCRYYTKIMNLNLWDQSGGVFWERRRRRAEGKKGRIVECGDRVVGMGS